MKLLIIHGWGSNHTRWEKVKELLEKKGIEVFIPDLPGFGYTEAPNEVWGISDYKEWVMEKLKEKGWNSFYLLGHSFGGGIAALIAAEYPQKVKKLVLCSPAIIRNKPKSKKVNWFYKLSKVGKKLRLSSFRGIRAVSSKARKFVYRILGANDYYQAQGIMKDIIKKVLSEDTRVVLPKIKVPTLILWGEKDEMLPVEDSCKIKELIEESDASSKEVSLITFPKAKHSLHKEIPEKLAQKIENFMHPVK